MKIETKYGINDRVFFINTSPVKTWVVCPSCEGTGRIELKDGFHSCPTCYGRKGGTKYGATAWQVMREVTIGQVRAYVQNFKRSGMFDNVGHFAGDGENVCKAEYMAYETGIGSGTVYYEERLWPTKEEAQSECDRLNSEIQNDQAL